ncbi:hypothetical protein FS749_008303 [Ceratobasidium sp. UAMH 11750]|nr:hypothetical protein FS749_008303 [Ceratobasidium sp. UAMH 11750]
METLSDGDYNMLQTTMINVVCHLGVVGERNIQYVWNPTLLRYDYHFCSNPEDTENSWQVNADLSQSSALASKVTGYPLAFITMKLGLHILLKKISNSVVCATAACFKPSPDYVVVEIPGWTLKFSWISKLLSLSIKCVGEVMSITRALEEGI